MTTANMKLSGFFGGIGTERQEIVGGDRVVGLTGDQSRDPAARPARAVAQSRDMRLRNANSLGEVLLGDAFPGEPIAQQHATIISPTENSVKLNNSVRVDGSKSLRGRQFGMPRVVKPKNEALRRAIGRNIYFWREHRKLTTEEVARRAGVSVGTINQIESGTQGFSIEVLDALARAYDTDMGALLSQDPRQITGLLEKWRSLRHEDQERASDFVDALHRINQSAA